jgi:hypothetical protein
MEMFSSEIAPYEPFLLFKVKENTFLKNVLLLWIKYWMF